MKNTLALMFCILLLASFATAQFTQWTNLGGPYKGKVFNIATASDGTVYVMTALDLWRSEDHGISWIPLSPKCDGEVLAREFGYNQYGGISSKLVVSVNASLFIVGNNGVLYRSTDMGTTWTSQASTLPGLVVSSIATREDAEVYVIADSTRVFHSSDNGDTWTEIIHGLSSTYIREIAVDTPQTIALSSAKDRFSSPDSVFISTNGGVVWSNIAAGLGLKPGLLKFDGMGNLYATYPGPAGTMIRGGEPLLKKTTDLGVTWLTLDSVGAPMGRPVTVHFGGLSVQGANIAFSTFGYLMKKSTDGGASWIDTVAWPSSSNGNPISTVLFGGDAGGNFYCAVQGCGLYRTDTSGGPWELVDTTMARGAVHRVLAAKTGTIIAAADSGIQRLASGTSVWHRMVTPKYWFLPGLTCAGDSIGTLYALCGYHAENDLSISTDDGATWQTQRQDLAFSIQVSPAGIVYGYCRDAMQWSSDKGASWNHVSLRDDSTTHWWVYPSCLVFGPDGTLYAGSSNGGVCVSTDNGVQWTRDTSWTPTGSIDYSVYDLAGDGFGVLYAASMPGLFRSLDWGNHWSLASQQLPPTTYWGGGVFGDSITQVNCMVVGPRRELYVGVSNKVYRTLDQCDHWEQWGEELPPLVAVNTLAIDQDGYLLVGTSEGTIFCSTSIVTSVEARAASAAPNSFTLAQNWPNPFNPSTTIAYQVGAGSRQPARTTDVRSGGYAEGSRQKEGAGVQVKLAVYDLLGREVAVLVDGYQLPGEHRVSFDARRLASGVYFYRLEAGSVRLARKMVVLK